jgi:hypothetical protein
MLKYSSSHVHELLTSVQNALRRYVEDEQKKREAANDAWVFSLARGKWEHVKYASGDVPRVGLILYQHNALMLVDKRKVCQQGSQGKVWPQGSM